MSTVAPTASGYLEPGSTDLNYVLGRGYQASARLNLQHLYCKMQTDYLLHPSIPLNKKDLLVADIGTGTGIWLLDLARELPPSTQLHGYDISPAQFPYEELLPKNVSFDTLDIMGPIPEHILGKYDVVYLRFFAFIVRNNDPGPWVDNLTKLLKPGGHLQWMDVDTGAYRLEKIDPSAPSDNMMEIVKEMRADHGDQSRGIVRSWVGRLGDVFKERGLTDTLCIRYPPRPGLERYWNDISLLVMEEYSYARLDRNPETAGTGKGAELRNTINKAFAESLRGVSVSGDMEAVVMGFGVCNSCTPVQSQRLPLGVQSKSRSIM